MSSLFLCLCQLILCIVVLEEVTALVTNQIKTGRQYRTRPKFTWPKKKRTTTKATITLGTAIKWTGRSTTERHVWPWNTLQFYETIGPEGPITPITDFVEFLSPPDGTKRLYIYPNRTEEEHMAIVAQRKGRANNTAWCQCEHCPNMTTDEDSVCCREDWYFNRLIREIEYEENHCYAQAAFTWMALREPDLEHYRTQFMESSKRHLGPKYNVDFRNRTQRLWRWLAYRYILRGLNIMTPYNAGVFNGTIPACVVDAVRGEFPEPDEKYPETGWSMFNCIRIPG